MGSFRVLGDNLLATVQERLDLFALELQEEKFRLIQIFCWISAAVFTGMMAITFGSLVLVYLFWASARVAILGGLAALYSAGFIAIIIAFRRYLQRQPRPFAATLQELANDRACLPKKN